MNNHHHKVISTIAALVMDSSIRIRFSADVESLCAYHPDTKTLTVRRLDTSTEEQFELMIGVMLSAITMVKYSRDVPVCKVQQAVDAASGERVLMGEFGGAFRYLGRAFELFRDISLDGFELQPDPIRVLIAYALNARGTKFGYRIEYDQVCDRLQPNEITTLTTHEQVFSREAFGRTPAIRDIRQILARLSEPEEQDDMSGIAPPTDMDSSDGVNPDDEPEDTTEGGGTGESDTDKSDSDGDVDADGDPTETMDTGEPGDNDPADDQSSETGNTPGDGATGDPSAGDTEPGDEPTDSPGDEPGGSDGECVTNGGFDRPSTGNKGSVSSADGSAQPPNYDILDSLLDAFAPAMSPIDQGAGALNQDQQLDTTPKTKPISKPNPRLHSMEHIENILMQLSASPSRMENVADEFHSAVRQALPAAQKLASLFLQRIHSRNYAMASWMDTGSLDVNALHRYRTDDDIFRTDMIEPMNPNHHFVLMADWSGSMRQSSRYLVSVIAELYEFALIAGVGLDVYLYTTGHSVGAPTIRHIASTDQPPHKAREGIAGLFRMSRHALGFGGTTIAEACYYAHRRLKAVRADCKHMLMLTDGEDSGGVMPTSVGPELFSSKETLDRVDFVSELNRYNNQMHGHINTLITWGDDVDVNKQAWYNSHIAIPSDLMTGGSIEGYTRTDNKIAMTLINAIVASTRKG